jgi:hypothetical protein
VRRFNCILCSKQYREEKSLRKSIKCAAAAVGLLLTVFFSILITSDFSKTQSYKKQLEIANFKTEVLKIEGSS